MTDPMEATEQFHAFSMSLEEYRAVLRMAGSPEWLIDKLVAEEIMARFQSLKHDRDTSYA